VAVGAGVVPGDDDAPGDGSGLTGNVMGEREGDGDGLAAAVTVATGAGELATGAGDGAAGELATGAGDGAAGELATGAGDGAAGDGPIDAPPLHAASAQLGTSHAMKRALRDNLAYGCIDPRLERNDGYVASETDRVVQTSRFVFTFRPLSLPPAGSVRATGPANR